MFLIAHRPYSFKHFISVYCYIVDGTGNLCLSSFCRLNIETKILKKVAGSLGVLDENFCENLANWSDIIRRTFRDGGIDEVISTRRLVHIIRAFAIWNDRLKAIKVCVNRFDDETKQSFIELYDKIDAEIETEVQELG